MTEARRLGEIAGPMLDRLHAQRERLVLGPWRVGVSWRWVWKVGA